jgi:exopolysaccharide production protein ExoZ
MAQLKTIQSLQAGRALAALAVLSFHMNLAARDFGRGHLDPRPLHFGYLGVDFFFVLSGFIIYHSTVGRGRPASDYAVARIRRVYLPYLPIGIGIALLYSLLPQLSGGHRNWSWIPSLTLLPVSAPTALSVAWTLKHEIVFYCLFGCFYFTGRLQVGLLLWAALITAANLAGMADPVPLRLINLEFLMGVGIAVLYRSGRGHWSMLLLAPFPLLLWIALGAKPEWSVLVGASLALIILPLARMETSGRLKIPAILTFLGAASYSIYLAHAFSISLAARLVRGEPYWVVAIATAAFGLLGGLAYFFIVERPLLRVAPGDRRRQRLTGEEAPTPNLQKVVVQPSASP